MKKKAYNKPQMDIVVLKQQQALLMGSYDGPANAIQHELDMDVLIITENDEMTFSDDDAFDFDL